MIFIDLSASPEPEIFQTPTVHKIRAEAKSFYTRARATRQQERFELLALAPRLRRALGAPLHAAFHGKCAYCETPLAAAVGAIDLFRPRAGATGIARLVAASRSKSKGPLAAIEEVVDPDAYWWLAYDWANFRFACEVCTRNKATAFPVLGSRAPVGASGAALDKEHALLLDPCRDDPEHHLAYDGQALVVGRMPEDAGKASPRRDLNRGAITIDLLGLNRPGLLEARRRTARELLRFWKTAPSAPTRLLTALGPAQPHCGYRRHLVRAWFAEAPEATREILRPLLATVIPGFVPAPGASFAPARAGKPRASTAAMPKAKRGASAPLSTSAPLRARKQRSLGFVRHIRIRNFKAIRDLSIEMPAGEGEALGWKVLLGENGSGKSSILQAVALALMGEKHLKKHLREFRLKPADLIRKSRGDRSLAHAEITIEFSTGQVCSLRIEHRSIAYSQAPPEGFFIRAYGATRLLPRRNTDRIKVFRGQIAKVSNLFDPAKPVFNAERWLADLKTADFSLAALSLKDLLEIPGFARLRRSAGKVIVPINGIKHGLDELSAGYESVLVMAADIMAGHLGRGQDFRQAQGLVLLDEIDAHLHPRLKMRIVDRLRRAFPSLQFLVTTHEPLCLRGVKAGEAAVVERRGVDVALMEDLPDPAGLRVDQLLTSNFFGLGSTIDPALEADFNRYYDLLSRPQEVLSSPEREELDGLRARLPRHEQRLIANSPREELLYEALDRFVARDALARGSDRAKLPQLRKETSARVAALWKNLPSDPSSQS